MKRFTIILFFFVMLSAAKHLSAQSPDNPKVKRIDWKETSAPPTIANQARMFFDAATDSFKARMPNGTIFTFGGGGIGSTIWTRTGTNVYLQNNAWDVGIGTGSPVAKLHVADSGMVALFGSEIYFFLGNDSLSITPTGIDAFSNIGGGSGYYASLHDTIINFAVTSGDTMGEYINYGWAWGLAGSTATADSVARLRWDGRARAWKFGIDGGNNVLQINADDETVQIPDLAGSGTRLVTASSTGVLATETIANVSPWTGNGTNVYLRDSSDNVGIGISSPTSKLDVNGNIRVLITNLSGENGSFTVDTSSFSLEQGTTYDSGNRQYNANILSVNGFVEINTTAKNAVILDTFKSGQFRLDTATLAFYQTRFIGGSPFDTTLVFYIDTNKNIGIGTATPTYKLTISAPDSVLGIVADSGAITYDGTKFLLSGSGTTTQFDVSLDDGSAPSIQFNINPTEGINTTKGINTTAGDAATIDAPVGRFRKDTSGDAFTLTNSFITANSIIQLTPANAAIDGTATTWTVSAGVGSAVITFNAAPTANFDMNFFIIN